MVSRDFLGGPVVKIPHAAQQSQKEKKKKYLVNILPEIGKPRIQLSSFNLFCIFRYSVSSGSRTYLKKITSKNNRIVSDTYKTRLEF